MPNLANRIVQGDCVEQLSQLEAGSVDLIFADPPFNIGYSYDVYNDRQEVDDYLSFCRNWIGGVHRALKSDGTFWLAIGDEFAAELKVLSQELGFHSRSWVIWYYTFGVNCVRGFSRSHTHLFHFVKDPQRFTFNGENPLVRVPSARQLVYADARANSKGRLPDNTWILRPQDVPAMGFSPSHDTWFFSRVAGTFKEREGFHGCQMPEQLLGRIIRVSSNPGDLVVDPFGGSGTTLVVAKKLGRRFLGFELSDQYVDRINERLEACSVGDALDGPEDPVSSAPKTARGKQRTAFANGRPVIELTSEIHSAVQDAFDSAAEDVDANQVLRDPHRNKTFVKACRQAKLPGDARTWNEFLLTMSREGTLRQPPSPKEASLESLGEHAVAAEVAFQLVSVDYHLSLEQILCTPEAAAEFDEIASQMGPPADASTYRSTIASLHHHATQPRIARAAKKRVSELSEHTLPESRSLAELLQPRKQDDDSEDTADSGAVAGVFAISDEDSVLYIGQSSDVIRELAAITSSDPWQRFSPKSVQIWEMKNDWNALVWRSLLVTQFKPWLNANFLYQEVATQLF